MLAVSELIDAPDDPRDLIQCAEFFERRRCHLTWIFRGFTRSAFGRVSVSTPSFISAVILCSSMLLGERLKLRR